MRRKNKRVAKIPVNQASSTSGESETTTNFAGTYNECLDTAKQKNDEVDCKIESDQSQTEFDNKKSDSIENDTILMADIKEEPTSNESSFLFVELKLISIDYKCVQYSNLNQKFLCIDAKASINHIKKFIAKKMNILEDSFEVTFLENLSIRNLEI